MSTDSVFPDNSENTSESQSELNSRVLPRSAWSSQLDYLRLLFRAKRALDRIEKEAGISRIYN